MKFDRVTGTIVGIVLFAFGLVISFLMWRVDLEKMLSQEVYKEMFKLNYQFLLIAVLGGFVSVVYDQLKKEQEKIASRRKLRRDLRQQFYNDYVQAINQVIKMKWLIGARAINGNSVVWKPYDELMEYFIDANLQLASLLNSLKGAGEDLYPSAQKTLFDKLINNLQLVVNYLDEISNEYHNSTDQFKGEPPTCNRDQLQALDEFQLLGDLKPESQFMKCFFKPEKKIRSELLRLLLES